MYSFRVLLAGKMGPVIVKGNLKRISLLPIVQIEVGKAQFVAINISSGSDLMTTETS